jgi:hypothetical protein
LAVKIVSTIKEWLELPEPSFPLVNSASEEGSVYFVHKVGFLKLPYVGSEGVGRSQGLEVLQDVLPTAELNFGLERVLCKLPSELNGWVTLCVDMAINGKNVFPTEVEFGILNGKKYAEIL